MSNSQLLLVMMEGPPGSGKSTLADGLIAALGPRAMRFGEKELFEVSEFSEVAVAFRTKTFPDTTMMLDGYRTFVERVRGETDVVVFDWSCVGMIEDLPCAQADRTSVTTHHPEMRADPVVLAAHARDVRTLANDAVLLVLDTPIATALGRALEQRGERWFEPWREVADFPGPRRRHVPRSRDTVLGSGDPAAQGLCAWSRRWRVGCRLPRRDRADRRGSGESRNHACAVPSEGWCNTRRRSDGHQRPSCIAATRRLVARRDFRKEDRDD